MNDNRFDDFVNKETKKDNKTVNWEGKLDRWKAFIESLYGDINIWLKDYVEAGKINIEFEDLEIFEEAIGKYEVRSMEITIGDNCVQLKPIGTVLIGTIGRIDVIGNSKTQKLVLADKKSTGPKMISFISTNEKERKANDEKIKKIADTPLDWEWKLTSNPPNIKYSELNQDSFFNCLIDVSNG